MGIDPFLCNQLQTLSLQGEPLSTDLLEEEREGRQERKAASLTTLTSRIHRAELGISRGCQCSRPFPPLLGHLRPRGVFFSLLIYLEMEQGGRKEGNGTRTKSLVFGTEN